LAERPDATGLARPGVLWLLLSALLALAALGAFAVERSLIYWQPQRWPEAWRWWSAALVHWTPMHPGAYLLATGLVAAYGWAARVPRWLAWSWCASWPLTHLALAAKPALLHKARCRACCTAAWPRCRCGCSRWATPPLRKHRPCRWR
jgi:hypothetical protein